MLFKEQLIARSTACCSTLFPVLVADGRPTKWTTLAQLTLPSRSVRRPEDAEPCSLLNPAACAGEADGQVAQPARASLACLGAAAAPALWMPLALEPLTAPDTPQAAMCTAAIALAALLSGALRC